MASAELSRRVEKVVAYAPLSEMSDGCRAAAGRNGDAQTRIRWGRCWLTTVVVTCLALLGAAATTVAAPPNDDFEHATPLVGLPAAVEASNVGASAQPGEPLIVWTRETSQSARTVWWRWRAPDSGPVALTLCSLSNSPWGAVFTGDSITSLQEVANTGITEGHATNCPRDASADRVAFFARGSEDYTIGVDSSDGGSFRLKLAQTSSLSTALLRVRGEPRIRTVYRAAAGELDTPELFLDWDPSDEFFPEMPLPPYRPASLTVWSSGAAPGTGCRRPAPRLGGIECPNNAARRVAGPLIELGDRDDSVSVRYSRPGTIIRGGPGDDWIESGGQVSGGPGADHITARRWSRSEIFGGPGDDFIQTGGRNSDTNPGPGADHVSRRDDGPTDGGVVRSRDGELDYISWCRTAYIDGLDLAHTCDRVHRRGAARAIPDEYPIWEPDEGGGEVDIYCPHDGPRVCAGTVTVSRGGRIFVRRAFTIKREEAQYGEFGSVSFRASGEKLRAMYGKVKITVRSRDRAGKLRTASGVYTFEL